MYILITINYEVKVFSVFKCLWGELGEEELVDSNGKAIAYNPLQIRLTGVTPCFLYSKEYLNNEYAEITSLTPWKYKIFWTLATGKKGAPVGTKVEDKKRGITRKFTEDQVRDIRKRYAEGETGPVIAKSMNMPYPTIADVIKGRYWKWVE